MSRTRKPKWPDLKKPLQEQSKAQLVKLIGDLYKLAPENRDFLHARTIPGEESIATYKKIVFACMWPELGQQWFEYRKAKKAISDYKKASGDEIGEIELMLHYVETANDFTCSYGDMDEQFYDSVLSMCNRVAKKIRAFPEEKRQEYRKRLCDLADSSKGIGWGYHDELVDILYETFPDEKR